MKLTVDPAALADAVAWAAKALANRPSVPVMAGLMLRATGGALHVSGFDYEVANQVSITLEEPVDDGVALVSGKLLAEITKALPKKPVTIETVGAHLQLVCGSARFTLPTMPAEDYPKLPEMPAQAGTIDTAQFAQAVAQVAVASGRDETLPMMTGVRIEFAGTTISMLATDRYRLAVREIQWTPDNPDMGVDVLVPARNLLETAKAFGPDGGNLSLNLAQSDRGEGLVGFATGGKRTTSRLLDGHGYPPVRNIVPAESAITGHAVVSAAALSAVVKRVALVAERSTPVLLSFSTDGLVVEAGGTEDARASEATDAVYTGQPVTIGFNPQYLLDGLAAAGTSHVHIGLVDAFKPALLQPCDDQGEVIPGYQYVIMPIRVTR
jgi:DNA polymerase-3 subunit beta